MSDYTLYQGDCLEVMPTLKKGSVAMVFADLPFGAKRGTITANYWDVAFDLKSFWLCLRHVGTRHAPALLTAKLLFACSLIASNAKQFRYDLVYVKSRATRHHHAKRMPLCGHEHVLMFGQGKNIYNPQMLRRAKSKAYYGTSKDSKNYNSQPNLKNLPHIIYSHRHPTTVLHITSENKQIHPTQKPVALLEWLIATYTNPGDLVLDPCFGSNTTGVACARLGRRYIGIERDAQYFAAGKARLEAEHARLAEQPAQGNLAV